MKELEKFKEFYAERIIKQGNIDQYKALLSEETYYILSEIGLPKYTEIDMCFDEPFTLISDTFLVIGKFTNEVPIMINLSEGESIVYDVSSNFNTAFLSSSLKGFLGCIYELEIYPSTIKGKFGNPDNPNNRLLYADYLRGKLYVADEASLDYSKGYYWGAILEAIEQGI